jgi:hypothetical protein
MEMAAFGCETPRNPLADTLRCTRHQHGFTLQPQIHVPNLFSRADRTALSSAPTKALAYNIATILAK